MEAFMIAVGRVAGLWRYPVKSMAAEEARSAEVSWHGLAGDRRWAFIRDVQVRTPSAAEFDVADPALAAELGPGVRVIKQDSGVFDTMPLSLLTTQALAGLGRLVGTSLAAERF